MQLLKAVLHVSAPTQDRACCIPIFCHFSLPRVFFQTFVSPSVVAASQYGSVYHGSDAVSAFSPSQLPAKGDGGGPKAVQTHQRALRAPGSHCCVQGTFRLHANVSRGQKGADTESVFQFSFSICLQQCSGFSVDGSCSCE